MQTNQTLSTLQHWLTAVLVGKGNLYEKTARAHHFFGLTPQDIIVQKRDLPIETRLGVYTTGYVLRLLECVEADLPALRAYWGEDLFVMFAKAYLLTKPSTSFSLYDLTYDFADFLQKTRPALPDADAHTNAQYDLPIDLARIERARIEALRRQGTEGTITQEPEFFAFFTGQEVYVQAHPCLQILQLKMPLHTYYHTLLVGEQPEMPEIKTAYLAVSRMHYRLQMNDLNEWQYALLVALQSEQKLPLHQVLHTTSQQANVSYGVLLAEANLWLPQAVQMGLVVMG